MDKPGWIMRKDSYISKDDLSLWEELRMGDKDAFSALFVRFYADLYAYALKLTKEETLSQDIVQELFLNIWQSHQRIQVLESIKPFLLRCTKNLIIDYWRKEKTIERTNQNLTQEEIEFSQEDFRISNEESAEQRGKVLAMLNTLPDRVKEAIYLRYFTGLNYTEIARVMDVNVQTARNFVHRGIRQMKDVYIVFLLIAPYAFNK